MKTSLDRVQLEQVITNFLTSVLPDDCTLKDFVTMANVIAEMINDVWTKDGK